MNGKEKIEICYFGSHDHLCILLMKTEGNKNEKIIKYISRERERDRRKYPENEISHSMKPINKPEKE